MHSNAYALYYRQVDCNRDTDKENKRRQINMPAYI